MLDIAEVAGDKIVDCDDRMSFIQKSVAEMRAQKPSTASYQHAHRIPHIPSTQSEAATGNDLRGDFSGWIVSAGSIDGRRVYVNDTPGSTAGEIPSMPEGRVHFMESRNRPFHLRLRQEIPFH